MIVVVTHKDEAALSPEEVRRKLRLEELEANVFGVFEVDATSAGDGRRLAQ